jgi:hypothetical protein
LIRQVHVDYATAIDSKDWELFGQLFDENCAMSTSAGTIVGIGRLTQHMRALHAPLDASLHRLTNTSMQISEDSAVGRTYLDALLVRAAHPDGPVFRVNGFYDDVLERTASGWRYKSRAFTAVWREGNSAVLGAPDQSV